MPRSEDMRMRMYNSNCSSSSRSQRLDFFEISETTYPLSTITCFCSTKIGHWLHQGITPTLQRHFLRNYHHRSPVFPSFSPSSYHIPAPYLTEVSKIWLSWPAKFFDPWKKNSSWRSTWEETNSASGPSFLMLLGPKIEAYQSYQKKSREKSESNAESNHKRA